MSEETPANDITRRELVLRIPGMDAVKVRKDVRYGDPDDDALTMDLYCPPDDAAATSFPAVLIVTGYRGRV